MPKVTVYIPTYNYGKYIKQAIESVLRQSYDSWELIVIDDASTDETGTVLSNFEGQPKVRIFVNQQNLGLTRNCNRAIELSRGEYIMRLDADDYLDENALLVLCNILDRNPEVALVYPDYWIISENGELLRLERRSKVNDEIKLMDVPAHGACSMIRKSCLIDLGGYNEDIRCQDGYDLWLRLIQKYPVLNINLPLFYYRKHSGSLTTYTDRILRTRQRIKQDFVEKQDMPPLRVLAIIPVRGAETANGLPLGLRRIAGKPLMDYTVQAALESKALDRIAVTSDNRQVLEYAASFPGVEVIYRKPELARLHFPIEPTVLHVLNTLKENSGYVPDAVLLLYINAPLREAWHIQKAIDTLRIFDCDSIISVREDDSYFYLRGKYGLEPLIRERQLRLEKEMLYAENGAIILSKTEAITPAKFVGITVSHILMSREESFQIDSEFEFWLVEQILTARQKKEQKTAETKGQLER
ncbi:MAG: glycosyltransferase [Bacillota bacterium]